MDRCKVCNKRLAVKDSKLCMKCIIQARGFTETLLRHKASRLSHQQSRTMQTVYDDIDTTLGLWDRLPSDDVFRITAYEIADCVDNVMARCSIEEPEAREIIRHVVQNRTFEMEWGVFHG